MLHELSVVSPQLQHLVNHIDLVFNRLVKDLVTWGVYLLCGYLIVEFVVFIIKAKIQAVFIAKEMKK